MTDTGPVIGTEPVTATDSFVLCTVTGTDWVWAPVTGTVTDTVSVPLPNRVGCFSSFLLTHGGVTPYF